MLLKGTVIEIIFRNEENGYTVFDMDADGRLVTAVGIFPEILEGESLGLIGELSLKPPPILPAFSIFYVVVYSVA